MNLIDSQSGLEAFCQDLAGTDFITVDTEFLRDQTYWPKLCLLQIGGPKGAAAIDVLVPDLDLAPVDALFDDTSVLKVFHAARQDLEIFYNLNGRLPKPLFDTQIAAMVCGFGDSAGYETLVRRLAGKKLDKGPRFTDWSKRPLTDAQFRYALDDVIYLREVYSALRDLLDKSGRASWLEEEMAVLTSHDTYRLDPENAWLRLKTRSQDRKYLAVLRELAAWREEEAQRRNVPRNRVLRDEQIYDIAGQKPRDQQALGRTRGLGEQVARGRIGQQLIEAISRALALPKAGWPTAPEVREVTDETAPIIELLKVLLKIACSKHDVAQKLVANSSDLEKIAADDTADVRALTGWRYEIFGRDALRLKAGELAIALDQGSICLIPRPGPKAP